MNQEKMQKAVRDFLVAVGEDPDREGLKETPRRVCGYWAELLQGMQYSNEQIAKMYGKVFYTKSDPLVIKHVQNVYSHCEHHLALMYNMSVTVAYLPQKTDKGFKVIGLSKIPRIVEMCAKRLQLQEKLAEDIAECIMLATGSNDVYVYIVADHACVSARGAKSDGKTSVTHLEGAFISNSTLRAEVERKI